jgi:hypothetical protein
MPDLNAYRNAFHTLLLTKKSHTAHQNPLIGRNRNDSKRMQTPYPSEYRQLEAIFLTLE